MTVDRFNSIVNAIGGAILNLVFSFAAPVLAIASTWSNVRGYLIGKIPIEGCISQLSISYAAIIAFSVGKLLVKTKAAQLANDPRPVSEIPNLPPGMAAAATKMESESGAESRG